jgi:hypothetical protein
MNLCNDEPISCNIQKDNLQNTNLYNRSGNNTKRYQDSITATMGKIGDEINKVLEPYIDRQLKALDIMIANTEKALEEYQTEFNKVCKGDLLN